ncbi:MAG: peptidoglycan DD-metalloendopeptidase family protein, partial [Candidatus Binatia bacterium]
VSLALLAACAAPSRGIVHVVQRGENLFRIGKAYGIDYRDLARRNGISDPSRIEVGQEIFVPRATRRLPVEIITPSSVETGAPPRLPDLPPGAYRLAWPTREGYVSSRFGPRNGSFHDGIDIAAPEGTPVHAARGGRVIYSDRIPGYGNIVIVDHGQDLSTVYAHNSKNLVSGGDAVGPGQILARVGRSGRTTGSNLHFEVRQRNVARNPLGYLPPIATSARR